MAAYNRQLAGLHLFSLNDGTVWQAGKIEGVFKCIGSDDDYTVLVNDAGTVKSELFDESGLNDLIKGDMVYNVGADVYYFVSEYLINYLKRQYGEK